MASGGQNNVKLITGGYDHNLFFWDVLSVQSN